MSKITLSEAVKIISVSESTLRRDMRSGKVSSEKGPARTKHLRHGGASARIRQSKPEWQTSPVR